MKGRNKRNIIGSLPALIKRRPYVFTSICVVVVFFFVSLYVRKTVSLAAEEKAGVVALSVAQNNTKLVETELFRFINSLEHLHRLSVLSGFYKDDLEDLLDYMQGFDPVIVRAWFCDSGEGMYYHGELITGEEIAGLWGELEKSFGSSSLERQNQGTALDTGAKAGAGTNEDAVDKAGGVTKAGASVISGAKRGAMVPADLSVEVLPHLDGGVMRHAVPFTLKDGKQGYIGLDISLSGFHDKIASLEELRTGYITIISNKDIFVLHPDEKMIGRPAGKADKANKAMTLASGKSFSAELYSDFLKIDVYRYYTPVEIAGKKWLLTANIPNIGFKEYVARISNILLFIAFAALFSFVAVILLGILRWRKEFVQRKNTENENLSLQLRNEQQKKMSIAAELENLKSGLNPHFLFNSLTTLDILVSRDVSLSKEFVRSLANLYRYLLDHEMENTVSLRTEMAFSGDYIYLQKIRFKDGILVDIDISEDYMDMLVPPVSVQLLIENCIKHNAVSVSKPLHISIFIEDGNLVVENNICPRHSLESSTGKGQENLSLRYSFLTQKTCSFGIEDGKYIASIPLL